MYTWKASLNFFPQKKLARLFLLNAVKASPDSKIINLLTFDNLLPPLHQVLPKPEVE